MRNAALGVSRAIMAQGFLIITLAVLASAMGFGFTDVRCDMERGPGSHSHQQVVDALNGRSIVFLGDSLIR